MRRIRRRPAPQHLHGASAQKHTVDDYNADNFDHAGTGFIRGSQISIGHTGGSSIPGSGAITGDHLLALKPNVSFHINGGPAAMPDGDFERVIRESDIALQVCTAGNLRTALLCARLTQQFEALDRLILASDTPTGSGVMPLGMLYTIAHLSSLAGIEPEVAIAAATGNNARSFRLDCGLLRAGKAADIVLIDAPDGGTQRDALSAKRNGDIAAVGAVISAGEPRFVGRSEIPQAPRVQSASHPAGSHETSQALGTDGREADISGWRRQISSKIVTDRMLGAA